MSATTLAAVHLLQQRFAADRLIYVSASESEGLHAQLAAVLPLLPGLDRRAIETISVGVIHEPGQGRSASGAKTRARRRAQIDRVSPGILDRGGVTGRAVYIRELLDKAQEALRRVTEESEDRYAELEADGLLDDVVKHAGLAAIIVQDLQARRSKVGGPGNGITETAARPHMNVTLWGGFPVGLCR